MKPIAINGRFLTQPLTGVQRYARELVMALDSLLASGEIKAPQQTVELFAPPRTRSAPALRAIRLRMVGHAQGHFWEQIELPTFTRGKLLFTPGGGAPLLHRDHVFTIPDASVFSTPDAYASIYGLWYRWHHRRAAGRSSLRFLTVSEFSKRELISRLKIHSDRITVIPEGHEHVFATEADCGVLLKIGILQKPYILAVGSANPNKNFRSLIKAFQFVRNQLPPELSRPLRLVISGRADTRIFSGDSVSGSGIVHTGYISDAELRALYENAACFVFPSFYEGFGLPLLEAMALGCATVCSASASLPEVGGDAVLYFDPHSPQEMADAIASVLSDPHLRSSLAARGRERSRLFRWSEAARLTWACLESE